MEARGWRTGLCAPPLALSDCAEWTSSAATASLSYSTQVVVPTQTELVSSYKCKAALEPR